MARGLIRNIQDAQRTPVDMPGVRGVSMAVMIGRADGAPGFALRHFILEPGGHSPRHSHDYEHEVYIVQGAGTVLLDGRERPIRAGDVVFVPADSEHQFRAAEGGEGGPESGPGGGPEGGPGGGLQFLCLVPVSRNCGEPTPGS